MKKFEALPGLETSLTKIILLWSNWDNFFFFSRDVTPT